MITTRTADILDQSPPSEIDAERALLGAILIDPSTLDAVCRLVSATDFHDDANGRLFDALATLHEARQPIADMRLLIPALRSMGTADSIWNAAELARLVRMTTGSHATFYATRIHSAARLRAQLDLASRLLQRVHDAGADPDDIGRWLDAQVAAMTEQKPSRVRAVGQIVRDVLDDIDASGSKPHRGILTGIYSLDEAAGVMMPAELLVLAARPGNGKTSLAMQIAVHNAQHDRGVLFVSLEMSERELTQRLLCSLSGVNERHVRGGSLSGQDRGQMVAVAGQMNNLPLHIAAPHSATVSEIRALARLHHKTHGLALLIVDYVGLITPTDRRQDRRDQVGADCVALKSLAKEIDIPVLMLSQLNREADKQRPSLANLRESGAIEEHADLVLFLHRPDRQQSTTELIVAKHRHGEVGMLTLDFIRSETRFADREPAKNATLDEWNN